MSTMSSSNYLQRSLHHYNSSPCLSSNTTRLLSSYATTTNTNSSSTGTTSTTSSSKQILTPKPVKVSTPAFSKPLSTMSGNNLLKPNPIAKSNNNNNQNNNNNFSSPSLDTSPTSPVDVLSGHQFKNIVENGSPTTIISGTPERLANEELHKILFSNSLSVASTRVDSPLPQSPHSVSTAATADKHHHHQEEEHNLPITPFSPFISHSPFPTRTFSPPTIELDINESILLDEELNFTTDDDVVFGDNSYDEDQPRSVPSTFGYDDEDFHSLRNDRERKRRNFVTQEDISFLIELRTRPKDNNGRRFPADESESYHRSSCQHSKVDEGYFGAEMGLLSFSPPNSRILNY